MDRVVAGSDAGFDRELLPARSRRETPGRAWHSITTPATANDDAGIPLGVRPGHGILHQNQESERGKNVHRGFESRGR